MEISVKILQYKYIASKHSTVNINLNRRHMSTFTNLDDHKYLFDQCHPIIEPVIRHREVLCSTTPEETRNFVYDIKGTDHTNWIKD